MRRPLAAVVGLVLVGLMAACGTDDNSARLGARRPATVPGSADAAVISGAGATFPATLVQEWIKHYRALAPGVTINYQPIGSGAGIQQLTARTVDFAGSDVPLKPSEVEATGGPGAVVQVPWTAGGVAVEYNLPGVEDLRLSPPVLAGVFAGRITRWNDPAIRADNPATSLPSSGIQVVHRSDGSGTTQVFTDYLTAVAPDVWSFPSGKDWPPGTAGTGAKGSDGVTAAVKQSMGAIGYAEPSFPKQAGLGIARVRNATGRFVGPTAAAVSAALASATVTPEGTLSLNFTPVSPEAYPISSASYLMFYRSMPDPTEEIALRHFAAWALTDGQELAEGLDYAPLPESIQNAALAAVRL
ncbi:MAG TPA: phosphate ABC transporter substrate-binding protein PstS [Acidimicrobiales bacterium]|nr:phosphate ABC transporter substrate-binding protein PstS [Acidimicrobiales bacterium]